MTSVYLFASAMVLPALMAANVGARPMRPEVAAITISASWCVATSRSPCSPSETPGRASLAARSISGVSAKHAVSAGANSCACCARRETLLRAAKATMRKCSGKHRTTSSVCRPIDPVLPSSAIRLGKLVIYLYPLMVKLLFTSYFWANTLFALVHPFALTILIFLPVLLSTIFYHATGPKRNTQDFANCTLGALRYLGAKYEMRLCLFVSVRSCTLRFIVRVVFAILCYFPSVLLQIAIKHTY